MHLRWLTVSRKLLKGSSGLSNSLRFVYRKVTLKLVAKTRELVVGLDHGLGALVG